MALASALGDVGKFFAALFGVLVLATLLLSGPVGWFVLLLGLALAGMGSAASSAADGGADTAAGNCPNCGRPVDADGAYCEECSGLAAGGPDGEPGDVVEGVHRR